MLPKRIGRYEVLGQLATGGMAEILLARITGPGEFRRAVVIKRILPGYAGQSAFVKMFLDEARIVATIRHPNVVQVQELGEHEGNAFLVMEYVEGENVSSILKRTVASGVALDPRLAAHVVAEMCAGLHAAHELVDDHGRHQNLVHRDVSPQNVIVGYDGHVKLVDFGIALTENRGARTEPGEVKGKFEYMSPEQGHGRPLDRRSDLFSAGVVLYELSTGRRLFKRPSAAKTLDAILREPVVPPSRVVNDYPPALDAIVQRALAKDPAERWATAAEMRKELLEVARGMADPGAELAARMRMLFVDRIAEKNDLLRRVDDGASVSHVPAGDLPDDVAVPEVPASEAPAPMAAPSKRPPVVLFAALGLVAFAALALVLGLFVFRTKKAESLEPSAVASAASAEPATATSVTRNENEVIVHVDSKPRGARVRVDGHERGETPTDLVVARGTTPLTIELAKGGFGPTTQTVTPDADQKLILGLTPLGARTTRGAPRVIKSATPAPSAPPSSGFRRFD